MRSFDAGCCGALEGAGLLVEAAEDFEAGFNFVALDFLAHHEFDAGAVIVATEFLEDLRLVVFASESYHEDAARIGVVHHVAEDLLVFLVVIAEL